MENKTLNKLAVPKLCTEYGANTCISLMKDIDTMTTDKEDLRSLSLILEIACHAYMKGREDERKTVKECYGLSLTN